MAEHRTVDARVVGSTPISHPEIETPKRSLFFVNYEKVRYPVLLWVDSTSKENRDHCAFVKWACQK